jgi:hypothetical protein
MGWHSPMILSQRFRYQRSPMEEVARCIGEKGEYLERGSNLTQAALSAREIADALIDQSKQKNSNCPCSGRITANPEEAPKRRHFRVGDKPPGTQGVLIPFNACIALLATIDSSDLRKVVAYWPMSDTDFRQNIRDGIWLGTSFAHASRANAHL